MTMNWTRARRAGIVIGIVCSAILTVGVFSGSVDAQER